MFRYSEIVVTCEGLGELVLIRTTSANKAQTFKREMRGKVIFGAKPSLREVISSRRKRTGVLQETL